jgi:hypothetical protein
MVVFMGGSKGEERLDFEKAFAMGILAWDFEEEDW